MLKSIVKNTGVMATIGILIGLFFGKYFLFLKDYFVFGLLLFLFLAALKIDFLELFHKLKKPFFVSLLTFGKLILVPIIIFLLSTLVPIQYRTAFILLAATPAALATPSLLTVLNGDVNSGFLISVFSNLLAPFILPFVLKFTIKTDISFDVVSMILFLTFIVFVPLITAFILNKLLPKLSGNINKYSNYLIGMNLLIFNISVICDYSEEILQNPKQAIIALIFIIGLSIIFHIIGILFAFKAGKKAIITSIIVMAYFNTGLSVTLAMKYFDSFTVLITVLYEIIWAVGLIPLQKIFSKKTV